MVELCSFVLTPLLGHLTVIFAVSFGLENCIQNSSTRCGWSSLPFFSFTNLNTHCIHLFNLKLAFLNVAQWKTTTLELFSFYPSNGCNGREKVSIFSVMGTFRLQFTVWGHKLSGILCPFFADGQFF